MKKASIIMVILLTIFFVLEAHAERITIRLICKYSHTIDEEGKSSGTSGEDLVTINYSNNGDAIIKKQGTGALFTGMISDEEIQGKTEFDILDSKIQETIVINRYTGAFVMTFKVIGPTGGIVHFGSCEPIKKKKF